MGHLDRFAYRRADRAGHPLQAASGEGYRSSLGILRLSNKHGKQRLELACAKAFAIGSPSYKTVKTMLDQRMEAVPLRDEARRTSNADDMTPSLGAVNVRGSGYYH